MTARILFLAAGAMLIGLALPDLLQGDPFPSIPVAVVGLILMALPWASKNARERVVVALISAALALGLGEVAIRKLDFRLRNDAIRPDSLFHHVYEPGVRFVRKPGPYDEFGPVENRINSLGARGPEPPSDGVDILILGDSYVQADEVSWDSTIQPRLGSALRDRGMPATVLAYGMRSWSPLLEWNWYHYVGGRLHPRLVFLFVFWNDIALASDRPDTDDGYSQEAVFDGEGRPSFPHVGVEGPVPSTPLKWALIHLEAARLADFVLDRLRQGEVVLPSWEQGAPEASADSLGSGHAPRESSGPRYPHAWRALGRERLLGDRDVAGLLSADSARFEAAASSYDLYMPGFFQGQRPWEAWSSRRKAVADRSEGYIRRLSQDVRENGGRLVLVYVPHPWQVGPEECSMGRYRFNIGDGVVLSAETGVQEWLEKVAHHWDLPLVDPTRVLRERASLGPGPLYYRLDCHWNGRGHEVMAETLADWIVEDSRRAREPH